MARPRKDAVAGENGSVEAVNPRITEAREDMIAKPTISYERPDPLKVEGLREGLSCIWERKTPNTITERRAKGFREVRKDDFVDPLNFKATYGDVVLMVADKAQVERSKQHSISIRKEREQIRHKHTLLNQDGQGLKGYVSGHSFNTGG